MIRKFNEFDGKILEKLDLTDEDLNGGITEDEFSEVLRKISDLYGRRDNLTDEEKILTEVLFNLLTKPERGYNYDTYYHRRKGFIENNKNKSK